MLSARALKHAAGVALQRPLPFCQLTAMNLIAARDLMDRLLLAQRLQSYFAFEVCGVPSVATSRHLRLFFIGCFTLFSSRNLSNFTKSAHSDNTGNEASVSKKRDCRPWLFFHLGLAITPQSLCLLQPQRYPHTEKKLLPFDEIILILWSQPYIM